MKKTIYTSFWWTTLNSKNNTDYEYKSHNAYSILNSEIDKILIHMNMGPQNWINLLFYLFFHRRPIQHLCRPFVVNTTFYDPIYKLLPSQWFELQEQQSRSSNKQTKNLKTNNYNNQWFKLQLPTAQVRRQKKLQIPQDLLKMSYKRRKAYRKETHNCWMGRRWTDR